MSQPGLSNTIADVQGIQIGSAEDLRVRTGVTVLVPNQRAVAAVDVRGGGPGTRETDLLAPENLVDAVDAIVLSGGSVYGLGAADAVVAAMGAQGKGFVVRPGIPTAPIVPAAILFDLGNGGDKAWGDASPYARLAREAFAACSRDVRLGSVGAGAGAMAGSWKGGLGSASLQLADGAMVGALVAVNAWGSVTMPGQKCFWAWAHEIGAEFGGVKPDLSVAFDPMAWGAAKAAAEPRANTTIAIVATDVALTPAQAKRVAIMAQDGLSRAIRPVHAPFDGDVVFALSTGSRPLPEPAALALAVLGAAAADALARAVARGVFLADGLGWAPAWREG
jgi:L-aminopeptidase/D-esterase-like protein